MADRSKKMSPRARRGLLCIFTFLLFWRVGYASDPVWLLLLFQAILALPLLLLFWLPHPSKNTLEKVLFSVCALFVSLIEVVVPLRVMILLYLSLLALLALGLCLLRFALHKAPKLPGAWGALTAALLLILLRSMRYYAFVDDSFFPFWQYALPIAIAVSALIVLLPLRRKLRFWSGVGYFALFAVLTFILLYCCLCHLNYALDDSEPQSYALCIEEKDYRHRRRSPDAYIFTFTVEGEELELHVSRSEYHRFEIGDLYYIRRYEGAFGKPFYVSGGIKK